MIEAVGAAIEFPLVRGLLLILAAARGPRFCRALLPEVAGKRLTRPGPSVETEQEARELPADMN